MDKRMMHKFRVIDCLLLVYVLNLLNWNFCLHLKFCQ